MAYPYSTLPTPITDATAATPTAHAGHHNSVHTALNDLLAELGTDPGGGSSVTARLTALEGGGTDLGDLHSALLAVKVWDTTAYVWSGDGTAPDADSYTQILFVDPTGTHDPASSTGGRNNANDLWETGEPGGGGTSLLATKSYLPSVTTVSPTATSFVDVDATNLIVTFTVPASGAVLVRLSAACVGVASTQLDWNLRESSSDVTNSDGAISYNVPGQYRLSHSVKITGLTPSASKTWKWGHARRSGSGGVGTLYGGQWGQALMEVWSA